MARKRAKAKRKNEAPAAPPAFWARVRPQLVAAFVLFHLAANCVSSLPDLGRGLDRRAWRDPRARRELQLWADRFGMERPRFEERIYAIGVAAQDVRVAMSEPFGPYMRMTGLRQSWAMFAAGTEMSDRFGLRVRRCPLEDRSCEWEMIYIHADPERAWRRSVIGHPRIRSAIFRWSWPSYVGNYERGCNAIARLVFRDFPDVTAVQCGFESSTTYSPSNPSPPAPVWTRPRVEEP
jgi:hypothetical protein